MHSLMHTPHTYFIPILTHTPPPSRYPPAPSPVQNNAPGAYTTSHTSSLASALLASLEGAERGYAGEYKMLDPYEYKMLDPYEAFSLRAWAMSGSLQS